MKRIIALMLVLLMTLVCFVSCGGDDEQAAVDQGKVAGKYTGGTGDDNGLEGRNLTNYNGYDYRILTIGSLGGEHWAAFEFHYDEELTGDALNEAVKERDNDLAALHNITVSYVEKNNITEFARDSILSGGDDFDLITNSLGGAGTLAGEGMLINLRDYDDVLDLEASYWDQRANEGLDVNGHLYFTCSDLTLLDKQATWVVFFTKGLLAKYPQLTEGYENGIYSMVEEGDWTIEKMYNMVKAVSTDDGDGVRTNTDTYGHFGESFSVQSLMTGCGAVGITKDNNGELKYVLSENVESLVTSYEYIYDIVHNTEYSMLSSRMGQYVGDVWVEGAGSMMEKNQVLFNLTGMNRCRLFRNLEADFGIIPMPKANEEQEDYSMLMTGSSNSVAIPINAPDKVRSCEILETMTYLASKTTYYAYIEQSLKGKYLRDDDSEAMLDIIFNNRLFDIGDVYTAGSTHFGATTVTSKLGSPETVASFIKKQQNRNEKALAKFLGEMEEVFKKTARQ